MKSLFLIFGIITALFLRAGVASNEINQNNEDDKIRQLYVESTLPYVYEIDEGPMDPVDFATINMNNSVLADDLDQQGFRSEAICFAKSSEGLIYRAFGNHAHRTQQRALNTCTNSQTDCEPLGCFAE